MPTQDELLLQFKQQGAEDVAGSAGAVAGGLDKIADEQGKVSESADKHTRSLKDQIKGFADLKAGLDLVGKGFGIVKGFVEESLGETMKYNKEVRDLAQNLSLTTEETSRIIQTADDFTVSQEAVTSALQMAVKKGMAPNIDTLAQMADLYNSINDPTERAAKLTEVFGRNWTALVPMLKEGGQAIRDAAASQDDALIVTEKQSQATRDLEKNMDNLGDKVTAIKLKIGNALIPVLNQAADAFDRLTVGPSDLGAAFVDSALKMQAEIVAGKMTVDQYNVAIANMAFQVKLWDANTGNALQTQYTLTQELANSTLGAYGQAGALDESARAARRLSDAEAAAKVQADIAQQGMNDQRDAILAEDAAMAEYNRKLELKAAAEKAAADAEAAHRASIAESITKVDSLSQSLAKATDAQAKQILAQAQLDVLKQAYEAGKISTEDFQKATDGVLLRYDLATPKSLAMAKGQDAVNQAFLDGRLSLDDYVKATDKIPKAAEDGKISLDELTRIGVRPTTPSAAHVSFTTSFAMLTFSLRPCAAAQR